MKVELDYEGMGTCINCDFKIDGKRAFTLSASSPETNDLVRSLIQVLEDELRSDPNRGIPEYQGVINCFAEAVHCNAVSKGWWESGDRNPLELHMLMVSEIAEATECARKGLPPVYAVPIDGTDELITDVELIAKEKLKPEGELIELSDVVIRIMDYCARKHWDLEHTIYLKHEFNKTRSYRHGNKKY